MSPGENIAELLRSAAARAPGQDAVREPVGRDRSGRARYSRTTFAELDRASDALAAGLRGIGVSPGRRMVLFVPFSGAFFELTFALFKAGAVVVLIDPGMGRSNIFRCLEEVRPDGFVAVPRVHALRTLLRSRFGPARLNVTVGRRWFWGGATLEQLRRSNPDDRPRDAVSSRDPAAIIFTSGATGPPKGVLYEHGMFAAQVRMIRDFYDILPGEIDLPAFPLFGLFNAAMGVTTVIPDMDPTRPAAVVPERIVAAIEEHGVTQAFGSPAFWNRVSRYCIDNGIRLPTLKRALSAGGPVPRDLLERMTRILLDDADFHTPYGATESLPVASITGREVLSRTAELTKRGAGTCVGRPFPEVDVKIVEITDGPIASLDDVRELPPGEIGEIIVRSPSVTREYFAQPKATRLAKIVDACDSFPSQLSEAAHLESQSSDLKFQISNLKSAVPEPKIENQKSRIETPKSSIWHRIGDVGYLDADGLLWFCGRRRHIVETAQARMYSVCCEAIFNEHPEIYRSALVGLGEPPDQTPVLVAEPEAGHFPLSSVERDRLVQELLENAAANPLTSGIRTVLLHPSLPVDTRHNVKIDRVALAEWAANQIDFLQSR
jgi:acyl-CoA synthetase (AMP-forming)/AMP-acid ligase II